MKSFNLKVPKLNSRVDFTTKQATILNSPSNKPNVSFSFNDKFDIKSQEAFVSNPKKELSGIELVMDYIKNEASGEFNTTLTDQFKLKILDIPEFIKQGEANLNDLNNLLGETSGQLEYYKSIKSSLEVILQAYDKRPMATANGSIKTTYGFYSREDYGQLLTWLNENIASLEESKNSLETIMELFVNVNYENLRGTSDYEAYMYQINKHDFKIGDKIVLEMSWADMPNDIFEDNVRALLENNSNYKVCYSLEKGYYLGFLDKDGNYYNMPDDMVKNLIINILGYVGSLDLPSRERLIRYLCDNYKSFYNSIGPSIAIQHPEFGQLIRKCAYMNHDEINLYLYILDKYGLEKASAYLNFKENELNNRQGYLAAEAFIHKLSASAELQEIQRQNGESEEEFSERLNKAILKIDPTFKDILVTIGCGTGDGIQNWANGIAALFRDSGVTTSDQYKAMYITSYINAVYNEGSGMKGTYNVSTSIGNMMPSILLSVIGGVAFKGLTAVAVGGKTINIAKNTGRIIGTLTMGLSAAGNTKEQGLIMGMDYYQARLYGAISGTSEAALGYLLGGIPGLSKMSTLPGLYGKVIDILGEGVEESLQEIIDSYVVACITNTEVRLDVEQIKQAGIYGILTAGIMNGGKIVIGTVNIKSDTETLTKALEMFKGMTPEQKASMANIDYSDIVAINNLLGELQSMSKAEITVEPEEYNPFKGLLEEHRLDEAKLMLIVMLLLAIRI